MEVVRERRVRQEQR